MKIFKITIILFSLFAFANNCTAQFQNPKAVLPGQKLELSPVTDTLWILNNTQFVNARNHSKELIICDSMTMLQKQIIANKDSIIKEQQGKIITLDTSYHHYISKWNACDSSLQKAEIKVVKANHSKKIIGIVSAAAGALIAIILIAVFK